MLDGDILVVDEGVDEAEDANDMVVREFELGEIDFRVVNALREWEVEFIVVKVRLITSEENLVVLVVGHDLING